MTEATTNQGKMSWTAGWCNRLFGPVENLTLLGDREAVGAASRRHKPNCRESGRTVGQCDGTLGPEAGRAAKSRIDGQNAAGMNHCKWGTDTGNRIGVLILV